MRIVFASHTHAGGSFMVGSHHLAREMHLLGHVVAHISTPVSAVHVLRLRDPEVRRRFQVAFRPSVADGVLYLVPLTVLPWILTSRFPRFWDVDTFLPPGSIEARIGAHLGGAVDLLIIDQPKLVGLTRILRPARVIYRPTDLYRTMPGNAWIGRAELRTIERSHVSVATSAPVAEHVRALDAPGQIYVLPNGVDHRGFAVLAPTPPEYAGIPRTRAIYVGAMDHRFDFAALRLMARAFPRVEFVLVGPQSFRSRHKLRGLANIRMLGPRSHAILPAYLQHAQVGLILMNDHPANRGRSPMKLYEYGAAGLPVLARRTPEIQRRHEPFVVMYEGSSDVVQSFGAILASRQDEAPGGDPRGVGSAVTRLYSWRRIAQRLLELADVPE